MDHDLAVGPTVQFHASLAERRKVAKYQCFGSLLCKRLPPAKSSRSRNVSRAHQRPQAGTAAIVTALEQRGRVSLVEARALALERSL